MRPIITLLTVILLAITTAGCQRKAELSDFRSDGCSLFPDRSLIHSKDWCPCCVEHDIAYWQGGTEAQRLEADQRLRECVLEKTGDEVLAETMFQGVRFGGSPYFYNWYRWGYGWSDGRTYQALSLDEERLVTEKLIKYHQQAASTPCGPVTED